jgi:DNA repair exonuclease SbcCD ATPase subunit
MWYLKELEIDGLMSFDKAKLEFSQGEVSIIGGKNIDAGDEKSNGSGKSAILEGVGFGITGSPLRKVKIGELVNDDAKQAFVRVLLQNDGLGESMEIQRVAFKKKSSVCQIFINGEHIDKLTSTDESNKFIETKLGILRDDLLNFFILMSAKFTPFLDSSDTKKKEVINRFSNGVIVDKSIDVLSEDISLCNEELEDFTKKNNSLSDTLGVLESTLSESLSLPNTQSDNDDKIARIRSTIGLMDSTNHDMSEEMKDLVLDLEDIDDEISDTIPPTTEIKSLDEVNERLKSKGRERMSLKVELQETEHKISHLLMKIDGSLSCPKCSHEFDPTDSDFNIDDATEEVSKLKDLCVDIISRGKYVRSEIDECTITIKTLTDHINEYKSKISSLRDEREEISSDISRIKTSVKSAKDRISVYLMEIDVLTGKEDVDVATPLRNKIQSVKEKIKPISDKLIELTNEFDELNIQLDVFRRFKSHLANLSLKSMEGLANDFLDDFGSDIFVQLNSDKKLASGKHREKIDSTLVRHGMDIGSFNKRSGGEKAAINLAFAKTLSHLINLNAGENRGLNLLVIDEILDSTDSEGLSRIVRSFEKSGDTVIIITHIPLPDSVGRQITVVKENDISKIL